MARSVKQWDTQCFQQQRLSAANPSNSVAIFQNTANGIVPGKISLVRVIGLLSVFVDGYVIGTVWPHLWVGAIGVELDDSTHPHIVEDATSGDDEDANHGSWLMREPVPFHDTFAYNAGDAHFHHRFDWAIRGGKGHEVRAETQVKFVATSVFCDNAASLTTEITLGWSYLLLFSGS